MGMGVGGNRLQGGPRGRRGAQRMVDRLDAAGVTLLRTDRTGMIVFRLGGPDNAALITKWRRAHGRPWHREPEL